MDLHAFLQTQPHPTFTPPLESLRKERMHREKTVVRKIARKYRHINSFSAKNQTKFYNLLLKQAKNKSSIDYIMRAFPVIVGRIINQTTLKEKSQERNFF